MHEPGMREEENKPEGSGGGGRALTGGRADPLSYVAIMRLGVLNPWSGFDGRLGN